SASCRSSQHCCSAPAAGKRNAYNPPPGKGFAEGPMNKSRVLLTVVAAVALTIVAGASSVPVRSQKGIVASQSEIASKIGADVIRDGGNAIDAVVATAFALAVTHPTAGNIGGGGFLVFPPPTRAQTAGAASPRCPPPPAGSR